MRRFCSYKLIPKAWLPLGLLAIMEIAAFAFVAQPALAQTAQDILNRLNRMENEIDTLSRSVYRGEAPPAGAFSGNTNAANMEVRLQQMESEIRALRGMIEEQAYETRSLKSQMERFSNDVDLRLQDLEGGNVSGQVPQRSNVYRTPDDRSGALDSVPAAPAQNSGSVYNQSAQTYQQNDLGQISPSSSDATGVIDTATAEYENAFALLKNEQFGAAETAFQSFVSKYPEHVLTANAQYWLGETYYVRGDYEKAARIFAESYQKYPRSTKAPDNLLKLGMSLSSIGNNADACVALGQLKKEFSTGAGPVMRRAEQEMTRLGC